MDGFVNILKAPGMTSSNVVYDVRKLFGEKHAGHLGTLDPGAAGVLPISLGRANKLFDLLVDKEKTYIFEVLFGISTDTLDSYGTVTTRKKTFVDTEDILPMLAGFLGESTQLAPAFSAVKVDGRKMYDLARNGEAVPERPRTITIRELVLLQKTGENRFLFRMTCSRGTYVRVVAEDMGKSLEVPAAVTLLLRTASGPFSMENACTVSEIAERKNSGRLEELVIPCETALMSLPQLVIGKDRRKAAVSGLPTDGRRESDGFYRLYAPDFLGVGKIINGTLTLDVHLYDRIDEKRA